MLSSHLDKTATNNNPRHVRRRQQFHYRQSCTDQELTMSTRSKDTEMHGRKGNSNQKQDENFENGMEEVSISKNQLPTYEECCITFPLLANPNRAPWSRSRKGKGRDAIASGRIPAAQASLSSPTIPTSIPEPTSGEESSNDTRLASKRGH